MKKSNLRATAAWQALALLGAGSVVLTAAPAFAQTTEPGAQVDPNAVPTQVNEETQDEQGQTQNPAPGEPVAGATVDTEGDDAIVVTGTILRATAKATPSPVQVVDFDESEKRGINTVNDAIQTLSANGAGALPNSFTAGGAFAAGASAASLRGLLTSNTLTLFDGLRAAYYPLADDGTRNFVDLNTVPDAVVDRIEVLKDGASSTYGADAIAGVVNIITKRQINGLHLNFSGGVSKYGDSGELNGSATYGFGDLDDNGYNAYISASYYKLGGIEQRDRGFPYNNGSCDVGFYTAFINTGECAPLNVAGSPVIFVRPSGENTNLGVGATGVGFELLNPAAGCQGFPEYHLSDEELENNLGVPETICTDDRVHNYFDITWPLARASVSGRVTANVTDTIEAYAMFNWVKTHTWGSAGPAVLRNTRTPPGLFPQNLVTTATLALPIYVCPDGTDCANDPARTLNPNNPFAAPSAQFPNGSQARVGATFAPTAWGQFESSDIKTRGVRIASGFQGQFANDWRWKLDGTGMWVRNNYGRSGYAYLPALQNAINTGELNWVNPELTPQSVLDEVFPEINNKSTSHLYQVQGSVAADLMELQGGPLQLGVGASWRWEAVDAPSANPDRDFDGNILTEEDAENLTPEEVFEVVDPNNRFLRVNPFASSGKRDVKSLYAELLAPVIDQIDISLSARQDWYSTGNSAFSPKAGIKITPIREIALRGSWSKGFRIPSFAEGAGTPTTGYVTVTANNVPDAYAANFDTPAELGYLTYSLGQSSLPNADLKPEKSKNLTLGVVAEPIRNLSFSVDYWNIKKTDVITTSDTTPVVEAYYAGQPLPEGAFVIPEVAVAIPQGATTNLPRIAVVGTPFVNAASQKARGIDFAADAKFDIGNGMRFNSNLEASKLLKLDTCFVTGCQQFAGTIGPYVAVSAAGSPKWRGSWQNILEFGRAYASLTAFYTSGYKLTAEDITGPDSKDDCGNTLAGDGSCKAKKTLYWNLGAGIDVTDDMNVYMNINNLFDKDPPLDTATYGGYLYNPAWSHPMMVGRFFRFGAKVKM